MTRKEEIKQKAKNKYPYIKGLPQSTSNQAIFIEAAKWADKTRLEQLLKYLEAEHPTFFDHFGEEIRKAMEE